MRRRHFFSTVAAGSALAGTVSGPLSDKNESSAAGAFSTSGPESLEADSEEVANVSELQAAIDQIPTYCSHEHWGSVFAIGDAPGGFRADFEAGALPKRPTTLADLIIDPYMAWNLDSNGISVWDLKDSNGEKTDIFSIFSKSPNEGLEKINALMKTQRFTGAYLCSKLGIQLAYGFDFSEGAPDKLKGVNKSIEQNYSKLFTWYAKIIQDHFSGLIRPVHPEYYATMNTAQSKKEKQITKTVMRIDPFMELWHNQDRRKKMAEIAGIEPVDAKSWRTFLEKMFEVAKDNGAVGIKQLQAYSRDLNFEFRTEDAVRFSGDLNINEQRILKDWITHECCRLADDLGWPHQIHVGTHNLPHSNPLPLEHLAKRYSNQKLVLLHCWPFLDESGHLAKHKPNIYLDVCWQPILNPDFVSKSFKTWLGYVPLNKITMGTDSTSVEMALGASCIAKKVLAKSIEEYAKAHKIDREDVIRAAEGFLNSNAQGLYK